MCSESQIATVTHIHQVYILKYSSLFKMKASYNIILSISILLFVSPNAFGQNQIEEAKDNAILKIQSIKEAAIKEISADNWDNVDKLVIEGLQLTKETIGDTSELFADFEYIQANIEFRTGNYCRVIDLCTHAIDVLAATVGPDCPLVLSCIDFVSSAYIKINGIDNLISLFRHWWDLVSSYYGPDSKELAWAKNKCCVLLLAAEKFEQLAQIAPDSFSLFDKHIQIDNQCANAIADYSTIFLHIGDYDNLLECAKIIGSFPKDDSNYLQAVVWTYDNVRRYYSDIHLYEEAINCCETILSYYQQRGNIKSPEYYSFKFELANLHDINHDYKEALKVYDECIDYFESCDGETMSFVSALNGKGRVLDGLGQSKEAVSVYLRAFDLLKDIDDDYNKASVLVNLANARISQGKLDSARSDLINAVTLYTNIDEIAKAAHCYYLIGQSYYQEGNFIQARLNHLESARLFKIAEEQSPSDLSLKLRLAEAYRVTNERERRITINEEILKLLKATRSSDDETWISYEFEIIKDLWNVGNSVEALRRIEAFESLIINSSGRNSVEYANVLMIKAGIFSSLGDQTRELQCYMQSIEIIEGLDLEKKRNVTYLYDKIATAFLNRKDYKAAITFADKALDSVDMSKPDDLDYYISNNLTKAKALAFLGAFDEANVLFDENLELAKQCYGEGSVDYSYHILQYAFTLQHLSYFKEAAKIYGTYYNVVKGSRDPEGYEAYLRDYYMCLAESHNRKAAEIAQELFELARSQTESILPRLTSQERRHYANYCYGLQNYLFESRNNDKSDVLLYNSSLFSKGILLGTSVQENAFAHSAEYDSEYASVYNAYQESRRTLIAINQTPKHLVSQSLIDSLYAEAHKKEIEYLSKYKGYDKISEYYHIEYKDIVNALPNNAAAIEFVAFDSGGSKEYVALVANKNQKSPIYVKLFNGEQLRSVLGNTDTPYYMSSQGLISLYELIWEPLIKHLKGITDVYFAPDGELYNIAIESLPCRDSEKCFSDIYTTHRVSSTKQICINDDINNELNSTLYGGLLFDVDMNTMEQYSKKYTTSREVIVPYLSSKTRGGFEYLPHTKSEVESISSILESAGYSSTIYSGAGGNEESFKSLSNSSPKILHIASHGFYLPYDSNNKNEVESDVNSSLMRRSGIILSGGQNFWGKSASDLQMEDGILTAAEIDILNLSGTDLLVLSACETALGDIDNDGVKGLQSAFKNAGVKTIIMSLWNVDDAATELMMVEFYKQYATTRDKDLSFISARNAVREKYKEPYYWASFIMLD